MGQTNIILVDCFYNSGRLQLCPESGIITDNRKNPHEDYCNMFGEQVFNAI